MINGSNVSDLLTIACQIAKNRFIDCLAAFLLMFPESSQIKYVLLITCYMGINCLSLSLCECFQFNQA